MIIENVLLAFDTAEELNAAEAIADQTLTLDQLELLETGVMYPSAKHYMHLHQPMEYNDFTAFCEKLIKQK